MQLLLHFQNTLNLDYLKAYRLPNYHRVTNNKLSELIKDSVGSAAWDGPYMKKIPKDPWENEYQYSAPGKHNKDFDLYSLAADGNEGGDEDNRDITNCGHLHIP